MFSNRPGIACTSTRTQIGDGESLRALDAQYKLQHLVDTGFPYHYSRDQHLIFVNEREPEM